MSETDTRDVASVGKSRGKKRVRVVKIPSAADRRVTRIPRPYGGEIVITTTATAEVDDYLRRTQAWFDGDPRELQLALEPAAEAGARELSRFNDVARTQWEAPPVEIEVQYEPPSGKRPPPLPPPIVGDDYAAIAGIERRGVSTFVLRARTDDLYETERGLAIMHQEASHVAEVEMRPLGAASDVDLEPATAAKLAEVRSAAAKMSVVVEDVLDVMISNAIENAADAEGYHTIDIDAILVARGLAKKRKTVVGTKTYAAGHHTEAYETIIGAIKKLDTMYVSLGPTRETKRKRLRDWDRVLNVQRYTLEEPSDRVHSVRYEFGTWFSRWKDDHVLAPRMILELDAKRDAPAKILARYFTQRRRDTDDHGRIVRRIRLLFRETATTIERGKNPQRSRDWVEVTLDTLRTEQIIASWSYVEDVDLLPRYKWLEPWLDYHIAVTLKA